MLPISNALLTSRRNRPYLRDTDRYALTDLKGIVMHWTANKSRGATAMANRNYFNKTKRFASAHYLVDDRTILQCLPDNEVGFHVGARSYKPVGLHLREGNKNPNYFLIGIEMCVNEDGDWAKTYQNTLDLTRHLLNKHNLSVNQLYRHYDITGKDCPRMMIDETPWQEFRTKVNQEVNLPISEPVQSGFVNVDNLNVRAGNGVQYKVVKKLNISTEISIYDRIENWLRIGDQEWVHADYILSKFVSKSGTVNVESDTLNVRSGPGATFDIVGTLNNGDTVEVTDKEGNWLKLEGSGRWVHHNYITFNDIRTGHVDTSFLAVRSGPGTSYPKLKRLTRGDIVRVHEQEGSWFRIGDGEWVHGNYVVVVN